MKTIIILVAVSLLELKVISSEENAEVPDLPALVNNPVTVSSEPIIKGELSENRAEKTETVIPQTIHTQDMPSQIKAEESVLSTQKGNELTKISNTDLQLPKSEEEKIGKQETGINNTNDPPRLFTNSNFIKRRPVPKTTNTLFGIVTPNLVPSTILTKQDSTPQIDKANDSSFLLYRPNLPIFKPLFEKTSQIGSFGLRTAGTLVKNGGQISDTVMNTIKDGSDSIQGTTQFIKDVPIAGDFHKPLFYLVNTSLDTGHVLLGDTAENVGNSLYDIGESVQKGTVVDGHKTRRRYV